MRSLVLLDSLINDTNTISQSFKDQIQILSEKQLNWKSSPDNWSISECIEHIILSGQHYLDEIEAQISKRSPEATPVNVRFRFGIFGNLISNSMKPSSSGKIRFRMKTMREMEPGKKNIEICQLFADFEEYQKKTLALLDQSRYYNLNKIKIKSSIGRILQFKLGNAFRFVIAHNERHIRQAINTVLDSQFPEN